MIGMLLQYLLVTSLTGSLFACLWLLAKPLLRRVGPQYSKIACLLGLLLFLLPLPHLRLSTLPKGDLSSGPLHDVEQAMDRILVNPAPAVHTAGKSPALSPLILGAVLYLSIAFLYAFVTLIFYQRSLRLLRRGRTPLPEPYRAAYLAQCKQIGLRRPPALYVVESLPSPVLLGLVRPVILLPEEALSGGRLSYILAHELWHHKAGDTRLKWLFFAGKCLHWANPLVHLLHRDFGALCEQCCDARVAGPLGGKERMLYAEILVDFAASPAGHPLLSPFSSRASQIQKRLQHFLCPASPPPAAKRLAALSIAGVFALSLLVGCSVPRPAASSPSIPSVPVPPPLPESTSAPGSSLSLPPAPEPPAPGTAWLFPVPQATALGRNFVEDGHRGLDIHAAENTPILAVADGEVVRAEFHYSYGNYVQIEHSDGLYTLYAHCSELQVAPGDSVTQGQCIGLVGSTGNTAGTLCHLEFAKEDRLCDPLTYVSVPADLPDYEPA